MTRKYTLPKKWKHWKNRFSGARACASKRKRDPTRPKISLRNAIYKAELQVVDYEYHLWDEENESISFYDAAVEMLDGRTGLINIKTAGIGHACKLKQARHKRRYALAKKLGYPILQLSPMATMELRAQIEVWLMKNRRKC